MLPNEAKTQPRGQNTNRRYSLFNVQKNTSSYQNPLVNILTGSNSNNNSNNNRDTFIDKKSNPKAIGQSYDSSKVRRNFLRSAVANQSVDMSSCQRCRSIEVDLTTASDNLNATDTELKASRQVINLLQRQLELFQVEKDGLEKLILSQSKSSLPDSIAATSSSLVAAAAANDDDAVTSTRSGGDASGSGNDDMQKKLLKLIQTQLYAKDEEIVKLKSSLKESQNEKEQIKLQVHMLEDDLAAMKTENSLLKENLALRDQTIVSLSNEVFEQGNIANESIHQSPPATSHRRQSNVETLSSFQRDSIKTQRHVAKLVDTLDAYKKTNELLSTNITKLTERCAQAEKKEIETRSECQELEAKCCQIQSKLLSLLKEIEQSQGQTSSDANNDLGEKSNQANVICSESVKSLIKRLLEDKSLDIPLSWKEGNRSKRAINPDASKNPNLECDELGFYLTDSEMRARNDDGSAECSPIRNEKTSASRSASNFSFLSQLAPVEEGIEAGESIGQRQQSVDGIKSDENSWRLRWDEFIKDFDKIDLNKSKEFKHLVRSGVPQEYRCKIWKALVDLKIGPERQRYGLDYYQSLLDPSKPNAQSSTKKQPQQQAPLNSASKQIELDLLRTLPNNKYFESIDSPGTIRLRKVLTAFAQHNQQVGYCQGMNRLAAVALLVLPEEEAFWCLVAIVDKIMPTGYYNDLWLAQVDSNVIMDFVALKMPNLCEHFKQHDIELSLFAWFLTIFVDGTPPALFLRLWDCFLFEGDKVMFRVALALLKMYENQLTTLNNSVAVNNFLRSAVNAPMNIDQFFEVAFDWINPLSGRLVRSKRLHHFKILRASFKRPIIQDQESSRSASFSRNDSDEDPSATSTTSRKPKQSDERRQVFQEENNMIDLSEETGGKVFNV